MLTNNNQPADGMAAGQKVDDVSAADRSPDPQGQAALLLVESLIHVLRERSVLTPEDALDVIDTAVSVQADVTAEADGAGPIMRKSLELLQEMASSLQHEPPSVGGRT